VRRLERVVVEGLFGYMRHEITVRPNDPTIITAPNGAGKTHVLLLVRAALSLDFASLVKTPFERLAITFTDSSELSAVRAEDPKNVHEVRLAVTDDEGTRYSPLTLDETFVLDSEDELPTYLRQMPGGGWVDLRRDRLLSNDFVTSHYRKNYNKNIEALKGSPAFRAITRIVGNSPPIMIDTKRLDAIIPRSSHEERGVFRSGDATVSSSSITKYIDQIRIQVAEARRSSIQATQSADLSFAARALAAAKATVKEAALHKRYDEIVVKYEELARNGLAVGDAPLEFPEKTTPTVRRILSVFLDDWEKRLQPLGPLNKKIQTLRDILDTKLKQSGKRTSMGEGGQLMFRTFTGRRIRVSSLSSGEQHLVALFTHLLFTAAQGSVVLIDEPEISMHAAWKHAFLEDISRVADLADLQVILATHSTAIINGRWDLTEELGFSAETVPVDEEDNEPEVDSDDVLA
jgi:hypothetical protein